MTQTGPTERDNQGFLLELSDRLRSVSDPVSAMNAVCEMLGLHLNLDRVGFCDVEVDAGGEEVVSFPAGWGTVLPLNIGRVPTAAYGEMLITALRNGDTVTIDDAATDPRALPEGFRAEGIRAAIAAPLIRDGRWQAALFVNQSTARAWKQDEIKLVEDVLWRTWEVIARARAEQGVRAAERRQALLFDLLLHQRRSSDEADILDAAAKAAGLYLNTDRTGFFELPYDDTVVFSNCWMGGRLPVLEGPFPAIGIGAAALTKIRTGQRIVFADARRDAIVAGSVFPSIGALAGIGIPIIRDDRWQAGLYVNSAVPRIWLTDEIDIVHEIVELTWDAVERLRAEKALVARTEERDSLWQLSPAMMLRCTLQGVILAVNPTWTEILGWQESELLGANLFDFVHPNDIDHTLQGATELSEGQGHARFENRYRCRDGSYR